MIDYRRTGWGHNLIIKQDAGGLLRGHAFYGNQISVGDRITWLTAYGEAVGEIVECSCLGDPWDMYRITVKVVERIED